MTRFVMKVECDNSAFCNEETGEQDTTSRAQELARILQRVMRQVDAEYIEGQVTDGNGNRVGWWSIEDATD